MSRLIIVLLVLIGFIYLVYIAVRGRIRSSGKISDTGISDEMKACPLCGESILAIANKCKHCGSMLETTPQQVNYKSSAKSNKQGMLYIILGIILSALWFGMHTYILFTMDTAIYGGVCLLYGVIQLSKES